MTTLTINGKDYKIKFGYNSFCDSDLMERVQDLAKLFQKNDTVSDKDVSGIGKIKDLFCVVRELLFVGFKKYNPAESLQEIGDLLDDYCDEETEEKRGLFQLFTLLSDELMNAGFLNELMGIENPDMENGVKAPQDHKKSSK
jgi:hypothetical protein